MNSSGDFYIHLGDEELPNVVFRSLDSIWTITFKLNLSISITYFLHSVSEVIAFKNEVLWAFQKWEREEKKRREKKDET